MKQLPPGSAKVNTRRVLQDGDFVIAHTEYNFFGPKVGFDIFRFEGDRIVEHWDNLQTTAPPNRASRTMIDGPTEVTDLNRTAANKTLVRNFVDDFFINRRPEKIDQYFDGDKYMQHNPGLGDGNALFRTPRVEGKPAILTFERVHAVLGEGNYVLTVAEGTFRGQPSSFYDLYRIENGKIAEHWDTIEAIPARSEWKNQNGKFGFPPSGGAQMNRREFLAAGHRRGSRLARRREFAPCTGHTRPPQVKSSSTSAPSLAPTAMPGTKEAPFKTLEAAAKRVNGLTRPGPTTVIVDEGTYALNQTAVFTKGRGYTNDATADDPRRRPAGRTRLARGPNADVHPHHAPQPELARSSRSLRRRGRGHHGRNESRDDSGHQDARYAHGRAPEGRTDLSRVPDRAVRHRSGRPRHHAVHVRRR